MQTIGRIVRSGAQWGECCKTIDHHHHCRLRGSRYPTYAPFLLQTSVRSHALTCDPRSTPIRTALCRKLLSLSTLVFLYKTLPFTLVKSINNLIRSRINNGQKKGILGFTKEPLMLLVVICPKIYSRSTKRPRMRTTQLVLDYVTHTAYFFNVNSHSNHSRSNGHEL